MNDDVLRLWPRAERILDEVLDLGEPERSRRVAEACGSNTELHSLLCALLSGTREAVAFLSCPALGVLDLPGEDDPVEPLLPIGTRVGAYRLVSEIGRGGMGVVYLAERDDGEFAQRVALKLLDGGARTPASVERFRREREFLAHLRHPNVARLYDGGILPDGAPYLVMELVEGRRIDEHSDAMCLTVEARLRLFLQVCNAVEYAHGQLIVHRDLKPANVLIERDGTVRLLDFGIARWIEGADDADATTTVARVMTPAYAAPEQFQGGPATVATDVYQLGLLLYELLSGRRAHGEAGSAPAALMEAALRRDPLPPSRAVVTACDDAAATLGPRDSALRRSASPSVLARQLAGDLDAIVLKALRKLPAERYATVEALRRDIENALAHRPVTARRGSHLYRARKTFRRHRGAFVAVLATAASLFVGALGMTMQARATAQERDRARSAESRASAINDFLVNEMLAAATPEKSRGREMTVAEVLASASRAVGPAFMGQPRTEGDVRLALAHSYVALARFPEARRHAEAAAALFANGPAADVLHARRVLAELTLLEGRIADARTEVDVLVADHLRALGEHHVDTLRARLLAARVSNGEGKPAQSESELRGLLHALDVDAVGDWRLSVEVHQALADSLTRAAKGEEASAAAKSALDMLRARVGADHPAAIEALRRLATARSKLLRHHDALALHQEVLERRLRTAGPDHPDTGDAWVDISVDYHRLDRTDSCRDAAQRALSIYERSLGAEHPRTIRALRNIAILASQAHRFEEAERAYERVIAIRQRSLGELHPDSIEVLRDEQVMFVRARRLDDARRLAKRIVAVYERLAASPSAEATQLTEYANFLLDVEPMDARDHHRALDIARRAVDATHRRGFLQLDVLGRAFREAGDVERAIDVIREALERPEAVRSWTTEATYVDLLTKHRAPEELERFLVARIETLRSVRGSDDPLLAKTMRNLAKLYQRAGRHAEAEQRFGEALAQLRKRSSDDDWQVARAKSELGEQLARRGALDEAEPLLRSGYETLAKDVQTDPALLEQARKRVEGLERARRAHR